MRINKHIETISPNIGNNSRVMIWPMKINSLPPGIQERGERREEKYSLQLSARK
jgi:hypothetical protein